MKQIIFDCDSTAGIPGYPMDDALALFYLLGRPQEAEVLAVTCTFGNGTTEQVYRASRDLLSEAGWERLPVICGASQGEEPVMRHGLLWRRPEKSRESFLLWALAL